MAEPGGPSCEGPSSSSSSSSSTMDPAPQPPQGGPPGFWGEGAGPGGAGLPLNLPLILEELRLLQQRQLHQMQMTEAICRQVLLLGTPSDPPKPHPHPPNPPSPPPGNGLSKPTPWLPFSPHRPPPEVLLLLLLPSIFYGHKMAAEGGPPKILGPPARNVAGEIKFSEATGEKLTNATFAATDSPAGAT